MALALKQPWPCGGALTTLNGERIQNKQLSCLTYIHGEIEVLLFTIDMYRVFELSIAIVLQCQLKRAKDDDVVVDIEFRRVSG